MPDQEMIERVAKSIHDSADWPWASTKNYNKLEEHQKEIFKKFAIAAIKAMREPTEKMINYSAADCQDGGYSAEYIWNTMIDSILND